MKELFSLRYILNTNPENFSLNAYKLFAGFFIILMAVYAVSQIIKKQQQYGLYFKVLRKIQFFSVANLLIGLSLLFFSYELIPILSARFWHLFWLAGMIVWIFFIYKEFSKIPEKKKRLLEDLEYKKYLP